MNLLNFGSVVLVIALCLGGCASAKYSQGPCDAVANRDDEWVVGRDEVMKKCRPVADHAGCVCDPL